MDVLYVVERNTNAFESARTAVDIVCAGESLTGWNNFGPVGQWPYQTYLDFFQVLCRSLGLRVANGGIAGEISDYGPQQVREYLDLFPNARYFVFGMGTNDLGTWPDTESTSRKIIDNLDRMVQLVRDGGKEPILFNVPHANAWVFPTRQVESWNVLVEGSPACVVQRQKRHRLGRKVAPNHAEGESAR